MAEPTDYDALCRELRDYARECAAPIADRAADAIHALVQERDGLVQWACVECEARFPQARQPYELEGVTHCSSCYERKVLATALRAAAEQQSAAEQRAAQQDAEVTLGRALLEAVQRYDVNAYLYGGVKTDAYLYGGVKAALAAYAFHLARQVEEPSDA
jgi:hypothetical protein